MAQHRGEGAGSRFVSVAAGIAVVVLAWWLLAIGTRGAEVATVLALVLAVVAAVGVPALKPLPMAAGAFVVATAALCGADRPPGGTLAVAGNVMLVRQDQEYQYTPALMFPLATGGVGYCTRADDRWWLPWPGLSLAADWPVIKRSTAFASDYSGFEFLGTDDGRLMFGWRDNQDRWHGPGPVLVHDDPLLRVRGRPGFLQYPVYNPGEPRSFWLWSRRRRAALDFTSVSSRGHLTGARAGWVSSGADWA